MLTGNYGGTANYSSASHSGCPCVLLGTLIALLIWHSCGTYLTL